MRANSILKTTAKLFGILAVSFILELLTLSIITKFNLRIRTLGMIVRDLPERAFSYGTKLLVLVGVDSMAFFLVICGSTGLFTIGHSKGAII
jgi:hypothetical protein